MAAFTSVSYTHLDVYKRQGKTYAVRGAVTLASFTLTLWLTQDIVLTLALMLGASLVVFFVYSLPQARAFYAPEQPQNARVAALLWECLPLAVRCV